ncbi:hypothetical protein ANCCEY_12791 [Ancylostoma ceylanicum]|uniref:Uncharacterized protein n=1 Tax=Ancylostoma ceylanicum TaxID=53326 RepID=A0A0D6L8F9_9BILA|nr:hypothetical protein ANCCEY_12791 [Ancylostoma ceylanicum]
MFYMLEKELRIFSGVVLTISRNQKKVNSPNLLANVVRDQDLDVSTRDRKRRVVLEKDIVEDRGQKAAAEVEAVAAIDINPVGRDQDRHHAVEVVVGVLAKVEVEVVVEVEALGISLGNLDQMQNQPKSVDDFVSYCQQIQRRQDKEDRREKGEDVSSDDEPQKSGSGAASPTSFKHPFGVKAAGQAEGIKINIVNATPLPTKTPQERILDNSQLRLVYPVSSGITHKENTVG